MFEMPPPTADMIALLDAEQDAIIKSDFDKLAAFSQRKLALLGNRPDVANNPAVREKLLRNAGLLAAASRGIRAALDTAQTLKDARNMLTYTADGTVHKEIVKASRLERKA